MFRRILLAAASALAILAPAARPADAQTLPRNLRCNFTQTVTASSAYASGNVVGGLITCSPVAAAGFGGIVQSGVLRDKAGNAVNYDLILLDQSPSNSTITDKSAVALNTADLAKVVGVISFSGQTLAAASTMGFFTSGGLGLAFSLTSGSSLYGILVTRGTPTFASTSDVSGSLIFLQD